MIAKIIVDVANSAVDRIFEYNIPAHLQVKKGDWVVVPFGPRKLGGFVLEISQNATTHHALKDIIAIKKGGKILPEMIELCKFMVEKYNIKMVDGLRLCLSSEVRSESIHEKTILMCRIAEKFDVGAYIDALPARSQKQRAALEFLAKGEEKKSALENLFGISAIKTLLQKGAIEVFEVQQNRAPLTLSTQKKKVDLNPDQALAVENISAFKRQTFLLFGVTGSGKTEVYMNVIDRALEQGKTAILLVPEISLTPQVFGHLTNRFGEKVAVLHSGLSRGERFDEWNRIQNGKAQVVVGARSAIFAPLENVGVIFIDEEHENSYTSETNPRYKTEEIALFRARYNDCPLVLGSATPSIETFEKTQSGEYQLLRLPHRVHETDMPSVQIVDMTREIRLGNDSIFSMPLLNALADCVKNKKQALLFLNRRGFSSFLRCVDCGFIASCSDCEAPLVYHKEGNVLKCHLCGKAYKPLTHCPTCKSTNMRLGAIGTQKIVEEISKLFPNVPILRMDNDTTHGKNGHQKILQEFAKHKPAILVGTQMIAKGHDFEDVYVVGIIDADQTLYQTDFKSAERTFQLITQVSGRAGRKNGGGKVFLQTYNPRHYVYTYAANYNFLGFYDREINVRETTNFPPFAVILRILVSHENENVAYAQTKEIFDALKPLKAKYAEDLIYFAAMKSPYGRIKSKFRFQVLMRFTKNIKDDIIKKIYQAVNKFSTGKCQIFVEINPSSLS